MKYIRHSIALTPADEATYQEIKTRTGYGVTHIFKAMLEALKVAPVVMAPALNSVVDSVVDSVSDPIVEEE